MDIRTHGYVTGTFDGLHPDHVRLLSEARKRCDFLTVGLTTDELAAQQKGETVYQFEYRRQMLEALWCVDAVVPHRGETKAEAWEKLRFDVLFTGDDYYKSDEFRLFEAQCPHIDVRYLPRGVSTSSTEQRRRAMAELRVVAFGLNGPVLRNRDTVLKPVKLGAAECFGGTQDVYGYCCEARPDGPRNWRWSEEKPYPNLGGVNQRRELAIFDVLRGQEWYPVHDRVVGYENKNPTVAGERTYVASKEERGNPAELWWLVMDAMDATLGEAEEPQQYLPQIETILADLRALGVVHGDMHQDNLMVRRGKVYLIDFGWCTHESFDMSADERARHDEKLATGWDETHLRRSFPSLFT